FLVGIGDKDVALHPDGGTAREFGLGLRRASTLGEGLLERGDVGLGHGHRSERDEMQSLLARPGRADGVGGAIPEWWMRLLQGSQRNGHLLIGKMRPAVAEAVGRQSRADALECINENAARLVVLDLV